ncbi:3'-5' exonuclease [Methylocystis hirsuta]|uniref:DNA 3'-5' helicase n=1 Tax=Methylocystis hirsuta TaxID=369798 RepID=A0A3M9XMN2_9HYPH|nr:3'-5' exonuclease [Methylocystis hirsuta]RNJ49537.1 ATP-dependent helicase [Methylocystis hirsuta]
MRPFISYSIQELERLFAESFDRVDALQRLQAELAHRKVPRAKSLAVKVSERLCSLGFGDSETNHSDSVHQNGTINKRRSRQKPSIRPTPEQLACLERFQSGESFKIAAFAGMGKTSTLRLLAESTPRRGIYLAFNKAAASEAAGSFPHTTNCLTTSALAYRAMSRDYSHQKLTDHMNANKLAEILNFRDVRIGQSDLMKSRSLAALVQKTLRNFMYSDSDLIQIDHVPRLGRFGSVKEEFWGPIRLCAFEYAKRVWQKMCDKNDSMPLGFSGYLKLWALSNPVIETDFIFLDEAQDTNPVVKEVLERNAQHLQVVYVGDRHQQIYEWMGAVNAMEELGSNLPECSLTISFRFGQEIADSANKVLQFLGEKRRLSGNPILISCVGATVPDAILARTNATVITELINAIDQGMKPHIASRTKDELERLIKGVIELKAGRPTDVPEWFGFENWSEVIEFVQSGEDENLKTFVNLVQTRSEKQILWALGQTVEAKKADIAFSTAHQAKGLQWRNVRLADDFPASRISRTGKSIALEAEARLFYVAMTRAQECVQFNPATLELFSNRPVTPPSSG